VDGRQKERLRTEAYSLLTKKGKILQVEAKYSTDKEFQVRLLPCLFVNQKHTICKLANKLAKYQRV